MNDVFIDDQQSESEVVIYFSYDVVYFLMQI